MTPPDWMTQPGACLELVTRLTAGSVALCAAEFLAARRVFANEAVAGWPLLKRRSPLPGAGPVARALGAVFRSPGILGLFWVWLLVALALAVAPHPPFWRPAAVAGLFVIQLLLNLRHFPIVGVGGDRMRLVLLGALALREVVPDSEWVGRVTLWFIGANCALAYCIAGLYRLPLAHWRDGTGLALTLRHPFMGDAGMAAWLQRHGVMGRWLTWGVLALEISFPLTLLGGPVTVVPALAATLLMHLAIGHLMGLSRFVWAFLAAYPAVIFTSVQVRDWLFR